MTEAAVRTLFGVGEDDAEISVERADSATLCEAGSDDDCAIVTWTCGCADCKRAKGAAQRMQGRTGELTQTEASPDVLHRIHRLAIQDLIQTEASPDVLQTPPKKRVRMREPSQFAMQSRQARNGRTERNEAKQKHGGERNTCAQRLAQPSPARRRQEAAKNGPWA